VGKILITGPGRSGTTFLLQALTRLGFDTGFEPGHEVCHKNWRAGCEWIVTGEFVPPYTELRRNIAAAPRVIKSPEWTLILKDFVQAGILPVEYVYIPLRDLEVAAKSRLDVGLDWQIIGPEADYDYRVMDQTSVHALALGYAIEACELCALPYTIMHFPRLVQDEWYCYWKLCEGLEIDRKEFHEVFKGLARPEQVRWR
jgi:hypothetical protein